MSPKALPVALCVLRTDEPFGRPLHDHREKCLADLLHKFAVIAEKGMAFDLHATQFMIVFSRFNHAGEFGITTQIDGFL